MYGRKIYARNCTVREIDKKVFKEFCDWNHIQGSNNLSIAHWGIFHRDALVGGLSLGKHHRQNNKNLILTRLCFKDNFQVIGGVSKLFKRCREWGISNGYGSIITWSDNRWSNGDIYLKIGFELEKELPPDYSYVNMTCSKRRFSKQSMKKSNTGCPADITEREWARRNGYGRIWDCGKKRWVFYL